MHRRIVIAIVFSCSVIRAQTADLGKAATALIAADCLTCHNAAARMGGPVLVSKAAALKGGKSGPAIAEARPDESLLHEKVRAGRMPAGNPLPAADRDLVRRWIEAGATKPIDGYVAAALAPKRLMPSPQAGRRTLIRRATFDLSGIPPTPAEIDSFLKDTRPDAYERLVDRLLDSPPHGERWGRHWLDVIRLGESSGYEKNLRRDRAWPFREHIIRSFNEDKPFDNLSITRANSAIQNFCGVAKPILEAKRDGVAASFRPPVAPHSTGERFAPGRAPGTTGGANVPMSMGT